MTLDNYTRDNDTQNNCTQDNYIQDNDILNNSTKDNYTQDDETEYKNVLNRHSG